MRLIIDFSVIGHLSWHTMFTLNYEPSFHKTGVDEKGKDKLIQYTELEELTKNIAKNLFYITKKYKTDDIVICIDAPSNWRAEYIKEWYHSRLKVYEMLEGVTRPTFYTTFDKVEYRIEYFSQIEEWQVSKVKVRDKINVKDFEHNLLTYKELVGTEIFEKVLKGRPLIPYYKGTRKNTNWQANTPKSEFKKALVDSAYKFAGIIGAKAICVENTEGDDVVAMAVKEAFSSKPKEDVVVVSVDQDLYQLAINHPNFTYYNPIKREEIPLSSDKASLELLYKIIGGDTSDNIKGVTVLNKKTVMSCVKHNQDGAVSSGKGTVKYVSDIVNPYLSQGLTGTQLFAPVYRTLERDCIDDTLNRNVIMVYLANIPKDKQEEILRRIRTDKVIENNLSWNDCGLFAKERLLIINEVNNES